MASRKIERNIDSGLWFETKDGKVAVAYQYEDGSLGINWYDGQRPAFAWVPCEDLDDLEAEMRLIQPDLRKWHTAIYA